MKESWKLITLLVIAMGGLLAYAFLPGDVAESLPLKQVGLAALTDKTEEALAQNDTALQEDTAAREPVDTTSQTVLLFGDSMSENLTIPIRMDTSWFASLGSGRALTTGLSRIPCGIISNGFILPMSSCAWVATNFIPPT